MKHFLRKLAALLLCALLPFAAYFGWVQAQPAAFGGSIMGGIRVKLRLLQETPGARLLLVGGSSVPYGLLCQPLAEYAQRPCINLGATAYLGLDYYLNLLRGELHEGDVVVLAPELVMYQDVQSYSVLWMAVENDWEAMKKIPLRYWPGMARSYHLYAKDKRNHLQMFPPSPDTSPEEQFAAYGYGPWGDLPGGHAENILEHKYNTQDTLYVDDTSADAHILRSLRSFNAYAARCGATVYLTYAPFNRLALESSLEELDALQRRLEEKTGLPFLGRLRDGILEEALFFDSNNHLTEEGQRRRTQRLLEDLAAAEAF